MFGCRGRHVIIKHVLFVLVAVSVGIVVMFYSRLVPVKSLDSVLDFKGYTPSAEKLETEDGTSEEMVIETSTSIPQAKSTTAFQPTKLYRRIVGDGENIKVGDNTEVHVLSAIHRSDYPQKQAFNVVLLTWIGSRPRDRTKFFCCLSTTPKFSAVLQTPAIVTFQQPGFRTVDMRYILYSCTLTNLDLSTAVKQIRYVAFAEVSCQRNMTNVAHEITIPRDGRNQFAICKSFAYGDMNPQQLVEWFEFAKVVGVSVVQAHYNNISDTALTVLRHYQKEGFLLAMPVSPATRRGQPARGFYVRDAQKFMDKRVILNDCLHRLSGYDYVGVVDFDELLIPSRPFNTLLEVLQNSSKTHPNAGVFYAHSYLNLEEWPDSDSSAAISFMRRLDRTTSDSIDRVMGQRSSPKIIYDPKRMVGVETHTVTAFRDHYQGCNLTRASYKLLHFRTCKKSAWKTCDFEHVRDTEMLRFRTRWLQGISSVPLLELHCSREYKQNITLELERLSKEN